MIIIRNLKEMKDVKMGPMDVYIGRYNKGRKLKESVLANPNPLESESERDSNLTKYKLWLWGKMQTFCFSAEYDELIRIGRLSNEGAVTLWCWCAPKKCHGDIIKAAIEWMAGNENKEI